MNLAQFNIAPGLGDSNDPIMHEFYAFIDPVNALAEQSPGFLWRLRDDEGGSSANLTSGYDDPRIIVNMSLWRDLESLKDFTYHTVHAYFARQRKRWFHPVEGPNYVLWWTDATVASPPTLEEARRRLAVLAAQGPCAEAFDFGHPYPASAAGHSPAV